MEHKYTNKLIRESSPYLLQHAHNPVDWYPWGEEAFKRARDEDKLLIISIGYSACHWCHVMEHDSFEDEQVAEYMNKHFVSVKVDREERPDVDQFYMDAANLMQGRGGWPLNAIALPDLRPVYAATYFPKERWLGLLENLHTGYTHTRERYIEYAEKLIKGIAGLSLFEIPKEAPDFTKDQLNTAFQVFQHQYDRTNGGTGRAPKFPMPDIYLFLLRYQHLNKNPEALQQALFTLDKMAKGGIYDQLGGGFARYSVDARWHVPHFEKMLYDNAQLLSLYAEGYHVSRDPIYKRIVYETVEWAEREMLAHEGGFYSALDADSEGEEGNFYVWKEEEFDVILGGDSSILKEHFGIGKESYWEHGLNVLTFAKKAEEIAATHDLHISEVEARIKTGKNKLFLARENRIRPGLDDKILFSWNALMLKGLLDAYNVFREEKFLLLAKNLYVFLNDKMIDGLQVYRSFKSGKPAIPAFLEDYALYIQALISYYQLSFDEKYLEKAKDLTEHVVRQFYDKDKGFFYFTAESNTEVLSRKIEISDNVIPSPNSVMAHNLYYLGTYYSQREYKVMAKKMLSGVMPQLMQYGPWYAKWAGLLLNYLYPFHEVAISGPEALEKKNELESLAYLPNKLYAGTASSSSLPLLEHKEATGRTMIYVCENMACKRPTDDVKEALEMLSV